MAFAFFLATGSGALVFWKGVRLVQGHRMTPGGLIFATDWNAGLHVLEYRG